MTSKDCLLTIIGEGEIYFQSNGEQPVLAPTGNVRFMRARVIESVKLQSLL
jgi:hypothetical protein